MNYANDLSDFTAPECRPNISSHAVVSRMCLIFCYNAIYVINFKEITCVL